MTAAAARGAAPETRPAQAAPGAGTRTVADAVLGFLRRDLGGDRLFTVPGEAFLPLLAHAADAGVETVTMRHEAGAGFAALADARLTSRPGVLAVNRSPGAANAAIAVDAAGSDPTPLLLIVGGARRGTDRRLGFQATGIDDLLGGLAPVVCVQDAGDLPRTLRRCAEVLHAPVRGPVVLVVPEDLWTLPAGPAPDPGSGSEPDAHPDPGGEAAYRAGPFEDADVPDARAVAHAADRVRRALLEAARPVLLAGRLLRDGRMAEDEPGGLLGRLGEAAGIPVLLGNKQQDLLDNTSSCYGGHLHLGTSARTRERLAQADLVVLLGDLPDEVHFPAGPGTARLVAVHPRPAGPGEQLSADPAALLRALAETHWPPPGANRQAWYEGWRMLESGLHRAEVRQRPDGVDFAAVGAALDRLLPDDAVLALDAGNFSSWVHRHVALRRGQRLLALASGAMGFGVPAAVAASMRCPRRTVVAVVGDGGLLMTGNELAAAAAAGRAPVVVVADNGSYGTIRAHQARAFPAADCATGLVNPELTAWARSFGLQAERVDSAAQVEPALSRALSVHSGYLLHVHTSLHAVHANFDLPAGN